MLKRIFIAINLPDAVKKELLSYKEKWAELFTPHRNEVSGAGPVRWVLPENLHITLVFLLNMSEK
ncbi:hypothetical protein IIA94_03325, partial [Patescibacteria group bacterium]|nr:hypothetical protein [Patescibacteria group bacterium]